MLTLVVGKTYGNAPNLGGTCHCGFDEEGHAVQLNVLRDNRPTSGSDRTIDHIEILHSAIVRVPGANLVRSRRSVS